MNITRLTMATFHCSVTKFVAFLPMSIASNSSRGIVMSVPFCFWLCLEVAEGLIGAKLIFRTKLDINRLLASDEEMYCGCIWLSWGITECCQLTDRVFENRSNELWTLVESDSSSTAIVFHFSYCCDGSCSSQSVFNFQKDVEGIAV